VIVGGVLPNGARAGDRKADPDLTITVLVYNQAQASPATLAGAEREAGRIFGAAGVRAVWLDCLGQHAGDDPQGLCSKAHEATDVALRVLPGPIRHTLHDHRFGFAVPPVLASVYYEYVVRLAKIDDAELELPTILGCVIAHEVGHLLLGPNSHSLVGIMRPQWDGKEIRLALMGELLFTYHESKLIQTEAWARMRSQTGSLKEPRVVEVAQSSILSPAEDAVIIGATQQQGRFLTCVAQISRGSSRHPKFR
jgi:hypothetical protein